MIHMQSVSQLMQLLLVQLELLLELLLLVVWQEDHAVHTLSRINVKLIQAEAYVSGILIMQANLSAKINHVQLPQLQLLPIMIATYIIQALQLSALWLQHQMQMEVHQF